MSERQAPILSAEGKRFADRCHVYDRFTSLIRNTYSQQLRPDGLVNFGVAENSLMHEELKEYWPRNFKLEDVDFGYGDQMLGSDRLNSALASFFNKYFHSITPVLPEHIAVGNGLTTVIEQLSTILCNRGEGFMTARPYYNGFDEDMTVRSDAVVVAVDVGPDYASPSTLDAFEHQLSLSVQEGIKPAAVMLTNPNNPLGFNYPRETIIAYARFCEKHNLHLVVDEIYALSQFENDEVEEKDRVPFTSILAIDVLKEAGCNPARVHVLYGVAKDFGANGFRIGACVSQYNPDIHKAFITIGFMMKVSSVSDSLWSTLLNDEEMLPRFISTNQELLGQTFKRCRSFFRKHQIPWLGQPTAALFFWIDLSRLHRSTDDNGKALETGSEKDEDLRKRLAQGGLFISPGSAYHGTQPGWFRFTFSIRPDILDFGLQRFETFIQATDKTRTPNDP